MSCRTLKSSSCPGGTMFPAKDTSECRLSPDRSTADLINFSQKRAHNRMMTQQTLLPVQQFLRSWVVEVRSLMMGPRDDDVCRCVLSPKALESNCVPRCVPERAADCRIVTHNHIRAAPVQIRGSYPLSRAPVSTIVPELTS